MQKKSKFRIFITGLIKAAIALVLFLMVMVPVSYMVRPELSQTRNNVSGFYAEPKNSLDVVFVGGSGTFSAFIPTQAYEKYGFTSYNLATNRMSAETMNFTVGELLKYQDPELVVFDVSAFVTHNSLREMYDEGSYADVRFNTDGFRYSKERAKLIWDNLPHNKDIVPYLFDFIEYHGEDINVRNRTGACHFFQKGYNFLPWGNQITDPYQTDEVVPLDDTMDQALDTLFATVKEKNLKNVLFVYYPYPPALNAVQPLEQVNYIEQRVEEAGFNFLNCDRYYEEFGFDKTRDYWNNLHWNIYGSEKVTAWMSDYLVSNYDLPDHRSDPAIADEWNADAAAFDAVVPGQKAAIDQAIASGNADQGAVEK